MNLNRVALVTGGGRGIGAGIALALAKAGLDVAVMDVGETAGIVEQIQKLGRKALGLKGDVTKASDRQAVVQGVLDSLGRLDVLVNNAGVAPSVRADILEATEESYDRVMGINLKGPYFLTQLVAREMIARRQDGAFRCIVNIASNSAYTASVSRGDYCLSKAGVSMATKLWAARLAEHGINVYEIRPGIIATDMTSAVKEKYDKLIGEGLTPIKRWGTPDDVAAAVTACATGQLPFSTAEVINVDGGFHLRTL